MIGFSSVCRRRAARLLAGFAAPVLLSISGSAIGAEPLPLPAEMAVPVSAGVPDLAAFTATALERQPSVAAARASLAAAMSRTQAVESMRMGGILFARDLPVRKQQAALGVQNYEASVCLAEAETKYGVTYFYIAYLYARQQQEVLLGSKKDLGDLHKTVKGFVESEQHKKFLGKEQLDLVDSYVDTLEGRRQETLQGEERALAALREAMGVGQDASVRPMLNGMPVASINAATTKEDIIALALSRRGEVLQTATLAQVTCLEISAQGRTFLPTLRTFAAGSDIHAQVVPSGVHGMEYRPGGLAPEMPTTLVGSRKARMDQASSYSARADAVAEKTRNLVTLEAEDAYYRWKETKVKAEHLRKAADQSEKYSSFSIKRYRDAAEGGFKVANPDREPPAPRIEDVMFAGATAVRMRIDANRAYFEYLLALATLERVTVGGFRVEFSPPPDEVKPNGK